MSEVLVMQEIERLKDEEKQQLAVEEVFVEDMFSAETVESLKIDESDTVAPSRPTSRRIITQQRSLPGWVRFAAAGSLVWAIFAFANSGILIGNWWALFLLFPAYKNLQSVRADRQRGMVTRQTRKALTGAMLAGVFTFSMLFNAWGMIWPMLLIGWGMSMVLTNKWRSESYV